MTITQDEINLLIHNPGLVQKYILDELEESTGIDVSSATNPFVMALEAAATCSNAAAAEFKNVMRRKYPTLALTKEDLYVHLTDSEIPNLFATPGQAYFNFYVSVFNMKDNGYKPDGANYHETTIPVGTVITGVETNFTLLNSIIIRIFSGSEATYVESVPNTNDIAMNEINVLQSEIIHDANSQPYIYFRVPIKQLTRTIVTQSISRSTNSTITIPLTDQYCYSEVKMTSGRDKTVEILEQTFSEEYLDPATKKVYITIGDDSVTYTFPDLYVQSGLISGEIEITLYETKGDYYLPLNRYSPDNFSYTLGKTTTNSENTIDNIMLNCQPSSVLTGGRSAMSFDALKSAVINNTMGEIDIPVTDHQIGKLGYDSNFTITKVEDILTSRIYTAYKGLPSFSTSVIKASPDIFNNTVGITLEELSSSYPEYVKNDTFIIKSGTVFLENNGQMKVVPPKQLEDIKNMSKSAQCAHFKENKYFYNFFNYAVDIISGATTCRIYHLDNPSILSHRILRKNQNVIDTNAYLTKYDIKRSSDGYTVYFSFAGDSGYTSIDKKYLKAQLTVDIEGSNKVYFKSDYNEQSGWFIFDIKTSDFITSNNEMEITNGESQISTKITSLVTNMVIHCYTIDPDKLDRTKYMADSIKVDTDPNVSVLTEDKINVRFGQEVSYLWNRIYSTYTNRAYRTYDQDVYDVYEEDVYQTDADGNIMFAVNSSSTNIEMIKLHSKGDYKLDPLGERIIKHKAGDNVLDSDGEPVVDQISGVLRYMDILMLEYEFKAASHISQGRYEEFMREYLENTLLNELTELNGKMLEQTQVLFRSPRSTNPVNIVSGGNAYSVPYRVSPVVTLYVTSGLSLSITEQDVYKNKIGNIINNALTNKRINLNELKNTIMNSLDLNINAVKITGLSPDDSEIIVVDDDTRRLTLDKQLLYTEYKETIVVYNITLTIIEL